MSGVFAVIEVSHPALRDVRGDCEGCMTQARSGAIMARATGSKGATHGDGEHTATVKRVIALIDLDAPEEPT